MRSCLSLRTLNALPTLRGFPAGGSSAFLLRGDMANQKFWRFVLNFGRELPRSSGVTAIGAAGAILAELAFHTQSSQELTVGLVICGTCVIWSAIMKSLGGKNNASIHSRNLALHSGRVHRFVGHRPAIHRKTRAQKNQASKVNNAASSANRICSRRDSCCLCCTGRRPSGLCQVAAQETGKRTKEGCRIKRAFRRYAFRERNSARTE